MASTCTTDAQCSPGVLWATTDTYRVCIGGQCATNPRDPQLTGGTIAIIVLASLAGLALLVSLLFLCVKLYRSEPRPKL